MSNATSIKGIFIFLSLSLVLVMHSCEDPIIAEEDTSTEHELEEQIHNVKIGDVEVIVLDKCQYLVYKETEGINRGFGYMAHKGNCNNPVHYYLPSKDTIPAADSTLNP